MTGEEIRDIGFLRWRDPFAWMERMKGGNWTSLLTKENKTFETAVSMIASKEHLSEVKQRFKESEDHHQVKDSFQSGDVFVTPKGYLSVDWHWKGEPIRSASVLLSQGDLCWCIEEVGEGREIYNVMCYQKGKKLPVWKRESSIGPFLAIEQNLCYLVEATGELQYRRLICLDAKTGKGRKVLFEESSLRHNLSIHQKEGGCIFLLSENSGRQRLYHIKGTNVERLCPQGVSFFPVGYGTNQDICYFAREDRFSSPWKAFGTTLKQWGLPKELRLYRINDVSLHHKILITQVAGKQSIYKCRGGISPTLKESFYGSLLLDSYAIQEKRGTISCIRADIGWYPVHYELPLGKPTKGKAFAQHSVHEAMSLDKTKVPYILVQKSKEVSGLMCIAYGAYNIPTGLSLARWKPYLDSGWALCFAMVRGGGDYGDQWAEDARRDKKYKSIEDVESVIRSAQRNLSLSAKETCLYGRSAGGYIVGAVCSHHSKGDLIGAAYAEVPYVDILRTTTNPTLPLTILEYDEFGNPAEKLGDLQTILRLSPVDSLPPEGAPGIFVVATTSTNDREVLPYECVKWILKLRGFPVKGPGQLKLLRIQHNHGHFISGSDGITQKAEDYILLQTYLETCKKC
jgi:hypothetical protein